MHKNRNLNNNNIFLWHIHQKPNNELENIIVYIIINTNKTSGCLENN